MNVRKMKFVSCIYTLFLPRFGSLCVSFWSKSCKIGGLEKLQTDMFGKYVQQPSAWRDVKRYVGPSNFSFIHDVASA